MKIDDFVPNGTNKPPSPRKAAKNSIFLVARPLRPYTPPPLDLNGHKNFSIIFLELQKTIFFLSGQALTPSPPLIVQLKKRFLRLPLARVATLTRKLSENVYLLAKLNKAWKKSKEEKNPLCPERET